MTTQFGLPGLALEPVDYTGAVTQLDRFLVFHDSNPHVLDALIDVCLAVRRRGRRRWSTNGAFEVLRYAALRTLGEDFKLNNNYRAIYARLIPLVEPELGEVDGVAFFSTRLQCDSVSDGALDQVAGHARERRLKAAA